MLVRTWSHRNSNLALMGKENGIVENGLEVELEQYRLGPKGVEDGH
jgi:hypothetical protein